MKDNDSHTEKISSKELRNMVESILFVSGKRVSIDILKETLKDIDTRRIKNALKALQRWYDENNETLKISEDNDHWKINVREKYLGVASQIVSDTDFSKATLETLSVIAWKNPILQSEMINIRGNKAYEHIDELLQGGFITKEKTGRSYILKITQKFFDYFDIEGEENIKEVFKKMKEKEVKIQKNLAEKKAQKQEELKNLEVINIEEAEKELEEAEDPIKEKIGDLEVFEEKEDNSEKIKDETKDKKDQDISNTHSQDLSPDENKENIDPDAKRTQEIVHELLKEDKEEEENSENEKDNQEDIDDKIPVETDLENDTYKDSEDSENQENINEESNDTENIDDNSRDDITDSEDNQENVDEDSDDNDTNSEENIKDDSKNDVTDQEPEDLDENSNDQNDNKNTENQESKTNEDESDKEDDNKESEPITDEEEIKIENPKTEDDNPSEESTEEKS